MTPAAMHEPRSANSGGPMSRRRTERVTVSVLRDDQQRIHLPGVIRAGLHFATGTDPLDAVLGALARVGLDDAEQLRERYSVPRCALLARVVPGARWGAHVGRSGDEAVLLHALLLGLCTSFQFDPSRPVIWTRASLKRRVALHRPEGFYLA